MPASRRSLLLSLLATSVLGGIAAPGHAEPLRTITIGATAGPYADQVKLGIKPLLEKKGYAVRVVEFNDYIQPNFALAQGALDANVFQHAVYLQKFSTEHKLALSEVIKVPTAPIALYSKKHKTLAELPAGATIALPNDPTNAARALVLLQQLGWVTLKDGIDPIRASERDVTGNPKQLKLVPLEAAQLPRSLDDTDYSVVNGNFAIASGLKLASALALETIRPQHLNLVAVRSADKDQAWVKDLADAYRSPAFQTVIDQRFDGFVKPEASPLLAATAAAAK